jgi:hypothetical protein
MRAEGVSFRHACELLKQEHLPLAAGTAGPPPKKSTTVKLPPLAEHTIDDKRLLESVVQHYYETLKETPEAQQYFVKRDLQSAEMLEQFRLGFANRTLGYHLPASNRSAGAEQRERLKQIGILRQGSGHERFNPDFHGACLSLAASEGPAKGAVTVRQKSHAFGMGVGRDTQPQIESRVPSDGIQCRIRENGGDDETRTRDLCRDRLGIHVLSATLDSRGAAKSLKRTVGTSACG